MIRTQIQLSERQVGCLKIIAQQQGVSVAELIRRAVDHAIDAQLFADEDDIRARALQAVGQFADTAGDVSTQHDHYLTEAFQA